VDVIVPATGHNDGVAGRTGQVLAFFTRADPRGAPPSGWALALDAAVAVGAAAGAVFEMTQRNLSQAVFLPGAGPAAVSQAVKLAVNSGALRGLVPGHLVTVGSPHASFALLTVAALTALPLAWRRVYPISAWLAVIAAIIAVHGAYVPPVALGTAVYAAYSAITYSRYRNLAITVVSVATVAAATVFGNELPRFPGRLTAVFAILPAAAAGLGIRVLRRRLADSTARLRRATDEAAAATERALAAERARIAAELHDVVTHNVSVMIVQAGAARKIMASSPADAQDALLAVESTGRYAMTELRNLLGLLSPAADGHEWGSPGAPSVVARPVVARAASAPAAASVPAAASAPAAASVPAAAGAPAGAGANGGAVTAALRPQPGLGELDTLIGRVSGAGLPVELQVSGAPRPLPPGADLAAYRVVQEGLTNVLRHAAGATASVGVRWDERLEITVSDDGRGGAPSGLAGGAGRGGAGGGPAAGPGRGLLGLRERLGLYGGELAAGPRPQGGWRLHAVLPLTEAARPSCPEDWQDGAMGGHGREQVPGAARPRSTA
jgi:signal transduction histidine kinase